MCNGEESGKGGRSAENLEKACPKSSSRTAHIQVGQQMLNEYREYHLGSMVTSPRSNFDAPIPLLGVSVGQLVHTLVQVSSGR